MADLSAMSDADLAALHSQLAPAPATVPVSEMSDADLSALHAKLKPSFAPFGDAAPGTWGDMGNFAARGVRDLAHTAATGLVRGGAGLIDQAYGAVGPEYGGNDPGTKLADKFFDKVMPEYKPATLPGKMLQSGLGGAALAGPFGAFAGLMGGLSGAGGEVGGEAGSLLGGEAGRAVGGLLGSTVVPGIPGAYAARRGALANAVRSRTEHLTPADWDAAQNLQDRSRALGVPLMAPEAMDSPALQRFTSDVRASRAGSGPIDAALTARPGQVRAAVNDQILDPITRQPITTGGTAEKVQGAAEGAIQNAERERSAQTSPYYQAAAADQVPADQVRGFVTQLDKLISDDPGNLNPTLRQARNALVKREAVDAVPPTRGQYVDGAYQPATPGSPASPVEPFTDIATLDRARKILRDRVELPPTAADAVGQTAAAETGGTLGDLRNAMTRASPDFAQGRALHEQISESTVNPLARSDVGTLADRAGIPENRGIQSQVNVISNPATARPEQIRYVANHLNFTDKTAFPELARTYFENALDAATKPTQGGENPAMGANFSKAVNGTDQQKANNRAVLEGVAQSHGIPSSGLIAGFNNAMEVLDRTARIPGIGSQTAERGNVRSELSRGPGTGLAVLNPLEIPDRIVAGLKSMYMGKAYRQFAQAITSPDGVQQLRRLSMLNPQSRQAQVIVGQLAGAAMDESAGAGPAK